MAYLGTRNSRIGVISMSVKRASWNLAALISRTTPEPNSGCWLWLGPVTDDGYGKQGRQLAHRLSWQSARGEIPPGACVCHRCDVRCCINPDHLFLGTQQENMLDMRIKGRRKGVNSGPDNGRATLTLEAVAAIRAYKKPLPWRALSRMYGVSSSTIYRVARGENWKVSK